MDKLLAGCYRIYGPDSFGHIRRQGRKWYATIRNHDGSLIRYAGIWDTLRDAGQEVQSILNPRPLTEVFSDARAPDAHLDDDSILEMPGEALE